MKNNKPIMVKDKGSKKLPNSPRHYPFKDYDGSIRDNDIDRLIMMFRDWGERPEVMMLEEFWRDMGLYEELWNLWTAKYPKLKEEERRQKLKLGVKRELMLISMGSEKTLRESLHEYMDRWDRTNKYFSELKAKQNDDTPTNITIITDKPTT